MSACISFQGVLFDMDNTLTVCQIDFRGIRTTLGIAEGEGFATSVVWCWKCSNVFIIVLLPGWWWVGADILTHIESLEDEEEKRRALRIVEDEELRWVCVWSRWRHESWWIPFPFPGVYRGFQAARLNSGAEKVVSWLRGQAMHVGLATRNNASCVDILKTSFNWPQPSFEPVLTRVMKSDGDVHKVSERASYWPKQGVVCFMLSPIIVLFSVAPSHKGPESLWAVAAASFGMSYRRGFLWRCILGLQSWAPDLSDWYWCSPHAGNCAVRFCSFHCWITWGVDRHCRQVVIATIRKMTRQREKQVDIESITDGEKGDPPKKNTIHHHCQWSLVLQIN